MSTYGMYDMVRDKIAEPAPPGSAVNYQVGTTVSFLEIYNEEIRDLLDPQQGTSGYVQPKLDVKQHPQMGVFVPGLTEVEISSADDAMKQLDLGVTNRTVASTQMNG